MVTDLLPGVAMVLAALLSLYFTFLERALSAAGMGDYASSSMNDEHARATEPRPRDRCQCGHTYDWHYSCARDVCGCGEFTYGVAEVA
jgi:hypothetical protein